MAETALGTCSIPPVRPAIALSTAARSTSVAGVEDVTSPSASSVAVRCPRRMVAVYSLSQPTRKVSRRVALPTPSTSTPVAIGSSVPAWPTLRVPARRRPRPTTSWEVQPAGLSTTSSPSGALMRRSVEAGGEPGQGSVRVVEGREAGCEAVATAAEGGAHGTHVDRALGAGGHLEAALERVALEHDRDLGLDGDPQRVDDPLDVGEPEP